MSGHEREFNLMTAAVQPIFCAFSCNLLCLILLVTSSCPVCHYFWF